MATDSRQFVFGPGIAWAQVAQYLDGTVATLAQPTRFDILQDLSIDFSFTAKELFGTQVFPDAIGIGNTKLTGKVRSARLNAQAMVSAAFGYPNEPAAGVSMMAISQAAAVPGSPYQVSVLGAVWVGATVYTLGQVVVPTVANKNGHYYICTVAGTGVSSPEPTWPTNGTTVSDGGATLKDSGVFSKDWGVRYADSGLYLVPAVSASTGHYTVSKGVYTFASGDTTKNLLFDFEYTKLLVGDTVAISNFQQGEITLYGLRYQGVFRGQNFGLWIPNAVSSKFTLNPKQQDFTLPEFDFSAFAGPDGSVAELYTSE